MWCCVVGVLCGRLFLVGLVVVSVFVFLCFVVVSLWCLVFCGLVIVLVVVGLVQLVLMVLLLSSFVAFVVGCGCHSYY